MKTEDISTEESRPVKPPDHSEDITGVAEYRPDNVNHTGVGNPLAGEFPPSMVFRGRDHVTGRGHGPPFRTRQRQSQTDGRMWQDMAKMGPTKAAAAPVPAAEPVAPAEPLPPAPVSQEPAYLSPGANPPSGGIFNPDGSTTDRMPYATGVFGTGHLQEDKQLPYRAGAKIREVALDNPFTQLGNTGPVGGALAGGVLLGGAGLAGSWLWNKLIAKKKKDELNVKLWGLIPGLLGLGIGARSGYLRSRNDPRGWARRREIGRGFGQYEGMAPEDQDRYDNIARESLHRQGLLPGGDNVLSMQPKSPAEQQLLEALQTEAEAEWHAGGRTESMLDIMRRKVEGTSLQPEKTVEATVKASSTVYDPRHELMNQIGSAGLPWNMVQQIMVAIQNMSGPEARSVRAAAGGLTGFALGMFLARRLGLGGMGQLGMSLAGGAMTSNLFGSVGRRRGETVTDMYGRPY